MTIAEMNADIVKELKIELKNESDFDEELLTAKVKSATREVITARNYPSGYTEARIEKDVIRFFSQIKAIARFDYNQIGAEGQSGYSADGEKIDYIDRNSYFDGIRPIPRIG